MGSDLLLRVSKIVLFGGVSDKCKTEVIVHHFEDGKVERGVADFLVRRRVLLCQM